MSALEKGDIVWADFGIPNGSGPALRRPAVVVQGDRLNRSNISSIVVAVITSRSAVAAHPGNVFISSTATGLPRDSVVNTSGLSTFDKSDVSDPVGRVPEYLMEEVDAGIRLVLDL